VSHGLVVNGSCHIRMSHGAYERVMPFMRVGHAHASQVYFPKKFGKSEYGGNVLAASCVAGSCSVLQCAGDAGCCRDTKIAVVCSLSHELQCVAACCSAFQCVAQTR